MAGYRGSGKVLLVQSFFERTEGYSEASDWYDKPHFLGLHRFTKTGERKSRHQTLIEALQRAVEMASMTEAGGRAAGLAAYDTWAQDMLRDEDFAGLDPNDLRRSDLRYSQSQRQRSVRHDYDSPAVSESEPPFGSDRSG